jgi:hypothetical protein
MSDAGAAKTRGRWHERRRSRGPARMSTAAAPLIVLRGRYKETAQ